MKIAIIVSGWPSIYRPNSMPFFYEQVGAIAKDESIKIDVYIPFSITHYLKPRNIIKFFMGEFESFCSLSKDNVKLIPVPYVNLPKVLGFQNILDQLKVNTVCKSFGRKTKLKGSYDFVHCHFFSSAIIGCEINKRFGTPYLITEHASDLKLGMGSYKTGFINNVYGNAKKVIAVGEYLREQLLSTIESIDQVELIPNGIDGTKFKLAKGAKVEIKLIFIGHLIPRKGILELLVAFKEIKNKYEKVSLTIIGEGELRDQVEQYVSTEKIESCVELMGALNNENVALELSRHHLLVLPSDKESFGVVVIEAGACGLPVVARKSGGPEYIIDDSSLGEIYDGTNSSLVNSIDTVLNKIKLYKHQHIRDITLSKYDWSIVAKKIISLYKQMINN
jgi:glycosyltransferase involved in cell wall biosynthesis